MSNFPDQVDSFREVENLPGLTYDAADKKTLFAEDFQALAWAIINTQEFVLNMANVMNDHFDHQDYKVGDIFLSFSSTNPSIQFGYGTWALVSQGRMLVGVDTSQTEFNTVRKTGGAKTHTLTTAEIPSHLHDKGTLNVYANAGYASNGAWNLDDFPGSDGPITGTHQKVGNMEGNTGSTGGDGAHNNLAPYLTCYIWERTA